MEECCEEVKLEMGHRKGHAFLATILSTTREHLKHLNVFIAKLFDYKYLQDLEIHIASHLWSLLEPCQAEWSPDQHFTSPESF